MFSILLGLAYDLFQRLLIWTDIVVEMLLMRWQGWNFLDYLQFQWLFLNMSPILNMNQTPRFLFLLFFNSYYLNFYPMDPSFSISLISFSNCSNPSIFSPTFFLPTITILSSFLSISYSCIYFPSFIPYISRYPLTS